MPQRRVALKCNNKNCCTLSLPHKTSVASKQNRRKKKIKSKDNEPALWHVAAHVAAATHSMACESGKQAAGGGVVAKVLR